MTKHIYHQLKNEKNYFPEWPVKYLFIGTFNPEGGDKVNYYYGREKNLTWKILSQIFKEEINPKKDIFFDVLKNKKIACIDIIDSICKTNEESFNEDELLHLLGKGYSDYKIINNKIKRTYNTNVINEIINKNNCLVFSTWGKGQNLKEWKNEVNKIQFTANLVSPSPVARVPKGVNKFTYILNDWKNKIKLQIK